MKEGAQSIGNTSLQGGVMYSDRDLTCPNVVDTCNTFDALLRMQLVCLLLRLVLL